MALGSKEEGSKAVDKDMPVGNTVGKALGMVLDMVLGSTVLEDKAVGMGRSMDCSSLSSLSAQML